MKRPNTCVNLIKAINQIDRSGDPVRLSRAMANVVVGQILPDGVVKGGSSLMFRYGGEVTRYTRDMDTARVMELSEYKKRLEDSLKAGWNGFTGILSDVPPPRPKDVPESYVMIPFDIKLSYCGRSWQTVRIEIGHDEIGDAEEFEEFLPAELADAFEALSFPRPAALRVMRLTYQIAQKLHAVSEPGSERAHDLIDLQLMARHSELDFAAVRRTCVRLFDYRRKHKWAPEIVAGGGWGKVYEDAYATIADASLVLSSVDDAVAWANELIAKIDAARANTPASNPVNPVNPVQISNHEPRK